VLEVDAVTVRFGGVRPLNAVALSFDRGTWGLIGPNGAGKTTFFNVLSGFVTPVSGTVSCFGDDLLAMSAHRRARWGMRRTFQQDQVIGELSVAGNIELALDHTRGRASSHGVEEVLDFVGLDFEPACLEFYKTERSIRTASSEQVRQPIYKEGIEQWRNFEPWLEPLKAALGELAAS